MIFAQNLLANKERNIILNNKISAINEFIFFPKTNTQKKVTYHQYDLKGNKILTKEFDYEGKEIKTIEFKYDQNNNEILFIEYDENKNIKQKCEKKYVNNILSTELFYDKNNKLVYQRVSKYDKNNNVVEQILYDKNNKLLRKVIHKYNNRNLKIETLTYIDEKLNNKQIFNYDERYNIKEIINYDQNNKYIGKKIYNYDNKELLTEIITYNQEGLITSWRKFEYEYYKTISQNIKEIKEVNKNNTNYESKQVQTNEIIVQNIISTIETQISSNITNEIIDDNKVNSNNITQLESEKRFNPYKYADPYNPPLDVEITPQELIGNCLYFPPDTVIKLALHNNIDINVTNIMGQTMLMLACAQGNIELVKKLLEAGANANLKDNIGISVSDYAYASKNSKIMKLIEEYKNK